MYDRCLFCGGNPNAPGHLSLCGVAPEPQPAFVPGEGPHHDGETYEPDLDHVRLNAQTLEVYRFMLDGLWHTLREISIGTSAPEASVSARLRDLRKRKFGGHYVERVRLGDHSGLFMYRLVPNAMCEVDDVDDDA